MVLDGVEPADVKLTGEAENIPTAGAHDSYMEALHLLWLTPSAAVDRERHLCWRVSSGEEEGETGCWHRS